MSIPEAEQQKDRFKWLHHVWSDFLLLRPIFLVAMILLGLVIASGAGPVIVFLYAMALVVCAVLFSRHVHAEDPYASMSQKRESAIQLLSGEMLAEQLPDPLIIFDARGTVLFANLASRDAFSQLAAGTSLYLFFRAPEMHALVQGVTSDSQPRMIDYAERVPLERWYKATALSLGGNHPREELFVLFFRDQTEARRIDRMRSDFIANASHELRTPLASLTGFIDTLRGPARNDAVARDNFLGIMQKQAERMARLIDDLLSLSRIEMKAHIAVRDRIDLVPLLNHVTDALAPLAADLGVTIDNRIGDGAVIVIGDRDELTQVFQNLLENACKYGQTGEKVILDLQRGDAQGKGPGVVVQDFGPGIPAEHIPRLTERFYRVDVQTSRTHKGTGLGLAIVKHILTRHKARLSIQSQIGKGSVFTVQFPSQDH